MNEMNQALRRQSPRSQWLLELATPSVALGRGLLGNEHVGPLAANANQPRAGLVETLVRTMKQRRTASQLAQLDTRLLDDIGIARGEINTIAAKAAAQAVAREGIPAMPRIASLIKLPAAILAFLSKAWRRQAAIATLQRLSNHTLADIGIERGCIAETIDAMIASGETTLAPAPAPAVTAKVATAKPVEVAVPAHKLAA
jgi:uncharacterized protein YjiS (DUF1127 family)